MQIRTFLLSSVLVGLTATIGVPGPSLPDELLKSSDHKKLAKAVSDYWDARAEEKDIAATFDKLAEEIDKVQKKLKEDDVLAAVDDWAEIFRMATERGLEDKKLKKGRITTEELEGVELTYSVGKKYRMSNGPFPLVIIVPDEGESPEAAIDAHWANEEMREGAFLVVAHMEGVTDWTGGDGTDRVMMTFGAIARSNRYCFDYNRVFLAGRGKGFASVVATASTYPHLFAGVLGRGEVPEADPRNLINTPSFVVEGSGGDAFAEKGAEFSIDNVTRGADDVAAAWAWLQTQARDPYPSRITYYPSTARSRAVHWLGVDGMNLDGAPRVEAVADRETNTITVDADEISSVRIYFNDALVDMSQPVKVVVNGVTHEEAGSRNRRTMIDQAFFQGDWGRVFTKYESYEVPAKKDQ